VSAIVPPPGRRWAISFADLALLIACSLLLGWRPEAGQPTSATTAAREQRLPVSMVFVDGEALLSVRGERQLQATVRQFPADARLRISVGAVGAGSQRLDQWELAAARTAVIARRLRPVRAIDLAAPEPGSPHVTISAR
jgi:hypothetical protein